MLLNRLVQHSSVFSTTWLLISIITLSVLAGCGSTPDAQRISDHIHELAQQVEKKSTGNILERLSETFSAKHLRSKKDVRRLLMLSFMKYKRISVLLTNVQVSINEVYSDQAIATFNVVATSGTGLIPDEGQAYRFTTDWEKVDGEWFLQRAEWKRAFE